MSTDLPEQRPAGRPNPPQDYPSDLEMKRMDALLAVQRWKEAKQKVNNERPR